MERRERIVVEIDHDTKQRFQQILEQNGQTASKIIRLKIQQYILMNEELEGGKTHDNT